MEESVDCLSGQSLCLLRIVIMNYKKRQKWLKQAELGPGEMGGFCMGCESFSIESSGIPCRALMLIGGGLL